MLNHGSWICSDMYAIYDNLRRILTKKWQDVSKMTICLTDPGTDVFASTNHLRQDCTPLKACIHSNPPRRDRGVPPSPCLGPRGVCVIILRCRAIHYGPNPSCGSPPCPHTGPIGQLWHGVSWHGHHRGRPLAGANVGTGRVGGREGGRVV